MKQQDLLPSEVRAATYHVCTEYAGTYRYGARTPCCALSQAPVRDSRGTDYLCVRTYMSVHVLTVPLPYAVQYSLLPIPTLVRGQPAP